jgi:hypothetical protein
MGQQSKQLLEKTFSFGCLIVGGALTSPFFCSFPNFVCQFDGHTFWMLHTPSGKRCFYRPWILVLVLVLFGIDEEKQV